VQRGGGELGEGGGGLRLNGSGRLGEGSVGL
jgi:hypothetical protein